MVNNCFIQSYEVSFIGPILYPNLDYPPASEASREVANLTERKNPHTLFGVKEFVCLSVTKFDTNYLRTGKTG